MQTKKINFNKKEQIYEAKGTGPRELRPKVVSSIPSPSIFQHGLQTNQQGSRANKLLKLSFRLFCKEL